MWRTAINLWALLWECKLVQTLQKIVWRFLKKLNIGLPYNPGNPILGIYPKAMKTLIQKDTCTSVLLAALYNSQDMEATQMFKK